jgi:hypothetical protein
MKLRWAASSHNTRRAALPQKKISCPLPLALLTEPKRVCGPPSPRTKGSKALAREPGKIQNQFRPKTDLLEYKLHLNH